MMQTPPLPNSYPYEQKLLIIIYKEIRFPDLPNSMSCFGWIWDLFAIQNTLSWVSNLPGEHVSYHQIIAREKTNLLQYKARCAIYYHLCKNDVLFDACPPQLICPHPIEPKSHSSLVFCGFKPNDDLAEEHMATCRTTTASVGAGTILDRRRLSYAAHCSEL